MCCKLLILPLLAFGLQAQIKAPQMGAVRCADGSVRPVYGVPGAFVLGKPFATSATAASFSETAGIIATRSAVLLLDATGRIIGHWTIADAGATVGIEGDPFSAIAWLPKSSSVLTWDGGNFQQTAVADPPRGRVLSVRRDSAQAYLLAIDETGSVSEYGISLVSGEIVSQLYLPGVTGAVMPLGSSLLFAETGGLALRTDAGTQSFPLSGSGLAMERMSGNWAHVTAANSAKTWAVHLIGSEVRIYELPGTAGGMGPQ
jgi:hypothetical protein